MMGGPCQPQEYRDAGGGLGPFPTAPPSNHQSGGPQLGQPSPQGGGFQGAAAAPSRSYHLLATGKTQETPILSLWQSPGPCPERGTGCAGSEGAVRRPPFRVSKGWGRGLLSPSLPRGTQGSWLPACSPRAPHGARQGSPAPGWDRGWAELLSAQLRPKGRWESH